MITNYQNFAQRYISTFIADPICGYVEKRQPVKGCSDHHSALKNIRNKFRLDLYKSFMNKHERLRKGACKGFRIS